MSFSITVPQAGGPNGIPSEQNFSTNSITKLIRRNTMKKLMLVAAVLFGTVALTFAQSVNVTTSIVQGVSFASTTAQDLSFGEIVVPNSATVHPSAGAQFVINGAGTHPIIITPTQGTLTIASGSITEAPGISYTYAYATDAAASESGDLALGGLSTAGLSLGGGSLYTQGSGYLGIGGTVTTDATTTTGSYSQTITLTVIY